MKKGNAIADVDRLGDQSPNVYAVHEPFVHLLQLSEEVGDLGDAP